MPMNTLSVGLNVTPTVVNTYLSHYVNRKPLRQKPTAHITYHEGLNLVRGFLQYGFLHTVEDVQAFTSQWVPAPRWVKLEEVEIPNTKLLKAADLIWEQLGPRGQFEVGGKQWWQWRPKNSLKAEWIEMRKDYHERKKIGDRKGNRIMLYVHGGAYYFGSVDAHRYQLQRHARKLKARVLAPRYRLAPQFPFPCGLQDNIAAYLFLLETYDPSTILFAGDSAGGGMVLSMLVTIRDRGLPLPAGAILLSPWVDLTHSFPSLCGDGKEDYIPSHGFVHKPSMSWPPPNTDDLKMIKERATASGQSPTIPASEETNKEEKKEEDEIKRDRVRGYSLSSAQNEEAQQILSDDPRQNLDALLSIEIDGQLLQVKDQIQLYATNHQLLHPLVSPVVQATLGGLPPLLIISGSGELLKDEQIYLAHKAANPSQYAPAPSVYQSKEFIQDQIVKYPPSNVQFQSWDDLCHVATTLSFTRPAKFMYRSVAQFGAWALARAQNASIDILDDDAVSVISTDSISSNPTNEDKTIGPSETNTTSGQKITNDIDQIIEHISIGKAGDSIPPFVDHIVRQRVDRHGLIYPLPPPEDIPALNISSESIGIIKEGPIRKWMHQQTAWNNKFAKEKLRIQKKRIRDMMQGYEGFKGENPPPSALAGRRIKGMNVETKKKKSWAMMMWSGWGSKHDEDTIEREVKADLGATGLSGDLTVQESASATSPPHGPPASNPSTGRQRSRTRHSTVTDCGQTDVDADAGTDMPSPDHLALPPRHLQHFGSPTSGNRNIPGSSTSWNGPEASSPPTVVPDSNTFSTRPTRDGIAYPFKLKVEKGGEESINLSTVTLNSIQPGKEVEEDMTR